VKTSRGAKQHCTPLVNAVQNKSYQKAITTLLKRKPSAFMAVIKAVVSKEMKELFKCNLIRGNQIKALITIKLDDFIRIFKTAAPTMWAIFLFICKKNDRKAHLRMVMSLSILLFARNQQINVLQFVNGLLLHQSMAQKEVVQLLNKLGVCVSYKSIERKLQQASTYVDRELVSWMHETVNNMVCSNYCSIRCKQYRKILEIATLTAVHIVDTMHKTTYSILFKYCQALFKYCQVHTYLTAKFNNCYPVQCYVGS
jgi:Trp operon repressor